MTVRKTARSGGKAAIVARQKLHSASQQLDVTTIAKNPPPYNITVGFNEKDQLQLLTKDDLDDTKIIKTYNNFNNKQENISIDDIENCVNIENYPNCSNTLVFYVTKNGKEAIALKFENEQDFKRIYFTYKYFKMRNRLTNNTNNNYTGDLFPNNKNNKYENKIRKDSIEDYSLFEKKDFDDGLASLTHFTFPQKYNNSRFDQPMSLIGIRNDLTDIGEIDSIIYTDVDIPTKIDRKRLFNKKPKAPSPPILNKEPPKVLKGEFVRVNVERTPDVVPKENKANKVPDILMFRDTRPRKNSPTSNLWSASSKGTGYESDREEWRSSRSQFSTTAFDSLARPAKMALTLRKPPRQEPVHYYRVPEKTILTPVLTPPSFRNNYAPRPPRLPRPMPEMKRNLSTDHRKFTSLQSLELPKKLSEPKKPLEVKKANYSNISHKITGITNKLRDLGNPSYTLGRFKAQSHNDLHLKPVLKMGPEGKRSVVRTCSAEPPKKVTFSAFATVQVV